MAIIENWMPPSRENWEFLVWLWQFFPVFTLIQWLTDYYPQGKTSVKSWTNIPGYIGWTIMEVPGFAIVLYLMWTLPGEIGIESLPRANWLMAGLFTVHYINRAVVSPLFLNPSMSPIHIIVFAAAMTFQLVNGTCIGGWLGGYGVADTKFWDSRMPLVQVGFVVFVLGMLGNWYYDNELRNLRRSGKNQDSKKSDESDPNVKVLGPGRVYRLPSGGLFDYILYPHYFCEWIEWLGFWIMGGWSFIPGQSMVVNEITTMTPRALNGRRWYVRQFGEERVGKRKAAWPGIL